MVMDRASDGVIAYTRAVAPHVDRLAGASQVHGALTALLRNEGLAYADVLIAARGVLLSGPLSPDDLLMLDRSTRPETVAAALDAYARRGLIAPLDGGEMGEIPFYTPTLRGRDLLLRLTARQGAAVTALWAPHDALLPAMASIATRVVGDAAATLPLAAYPGFRLQQAVPAPLGATPAHLLLTRLVALRALRADATSGVWRAHGFDATQARALTTVCCAAGPSARDERNGVGHDEDALATLHTRRLVGHESGHWHITAPGRTLHASIEQEIDERTAQPFAAVEAPERAVLLLGLKRLPG